jgi:hypothetical protein
MMQGLTYRCSNLGEIFNLVKVDFCARSARFAQSNLTEQPPDQARGHLCPPWQLMLYNARVLLIFVKVA